MSDVVGQPSIGIFWVNEPKLLADRIKRTFQTFLDVLNRLSWTRPNSAFVHGFMKGEAAFSNTWKRSKMDLYNAHERQQCQAQWWPVFCLSSNWAVTMFRAQKRMWCGCCAASSLGTNTANSTYATLHIAASHQVTRVGFFPFARPAAIKLHDRLFNDARARDRSYKMSVFRIDNWIAAELAGQGPV
jgi:hypothetical protein